MAAVMRRNDVPGAVLMVISDGQVVYRKAYGLRDHERQLPAELSTHFEIGSITRQFTAAAILQLQEAGKIDVDAKLSSYLPDAPHAAEVTLRHLLTHTSGLPEYLDGPDIDVAATRPATFEQLMARIAGKPLVRLVSGQHRLHHRRLAQMGCGIDRRQGRLEEKLRGHDRAVHDGSG
ncbi:MAG TPA: serine hydrolase domain-containing protein [Myxococcales bacterium]|nr:serine hydrolase domain-containing protein [Myxococcales bacterium]